MSSRTLVVLAGNPVQSTDSNSASSVVERDSSGNSRFSKPIAEIALTSEGGLILGYASKTTNYTADEGDHLLAVDCTAGATTVTLPPASTNAGLVLVVKKTDSTVNLLTVDGNASETIDGDTAIYLTTKFESVRLECDATGWHILDRFLPQTYVSKSALFTAGGDGVIYDLTAGGSGFTITLPPAANWKGKVLSFLRADAGAGNLVLDGNASETIDGATTLTLSATQYKATSIISTGAGWRSLSEVD